MAAAGADRREVYRIQVLERAFNILDFLADQDSELGLTELSLRVGLHRSTLHRLMMVLERKRYVERNSVTGRYRLGSKLLELGTKAAATLDLPAVARPFLVQLVSETGETAHIGVLRQGEILSITNVASPRTLAAPATVGRRSPAYCSALGKCLLAALSESELDDYIESIRFEPFTVHTITRPNLLRAELQRVRQRGFAVDHEEREEGLKCIGAPIQDHTGTAVAGVSIAGPASRLRRARMPSLTAAVRRAAAGISAAIGYRGGSSRVEAATPRSSAPTKSYSRVRAAGR